MRKQIFFTSDWHIGHENCLKFDNRPFRDLAHMHSELIKNFNKQVPKDGLTYFLGDIFLGSSEEAKTVLSQLNGTKILIVGNHDKKYEACSSGTSQASNGLICLVIVHLLHYSTQLHHRSVGISIGF